MAIAIFNRKKQFYASEVEGLVKQLTNFEEDEHNYQEIEKFIYSNIIHHNFATVDITSVKTSIDRYVEKLSAHGLNQRARRFRELVDKYVASDSSHHTQLNVQWHVLWLLLNLSTRPVSVPEEDLKIEELPEFFKPEEDINWAEYLREGLEEYQPPTDDSDDEIEWLSESEEGKEEEKKEDVKGEIKQKQDLDESLHFAKVKDLQSFGNIPHPSLWRPVPACPSKHESLRRIIRDERQAEQWLSNNVQPSWWTDASRRCIPCSKYPEARVCQIWEEWQHSKFGRDSVPLEPQLLVISEFQILHEVLWMLQVPTSSALFCLNENEEFYVKSNVSIPSTLPETCSLYLDMLCPYINMVNTLKIFEETLYEQEMGDSPPPVTYKAYCAALCRQLQKFTNTVVGIERRLNRQEETMTLMTVMEELSSGFKILQYLHSIHLKAVTDWISQTAWFCATRLLSVLYEIVCEASDEKFLEISLDIFIHSFHPYLDIIDVWLCEGRLEDWRKEFLVIKEDGGVPEVMPYESEMVGCGVAPVSLLRSLVEVVREAGTTMEIVHSLNKLPEFRDTVRNKGCLFKEFSDNVYSEIKRIKEKIAESTEDEKEKLDNFSEKSSYVSVKSSLNNLIEVNKETSLVLSPMSASKVSLPSPIVETPNTEKANIPLHLLALSEKEIYDRTLSVLLQNPLLGEVFKGYVSPAKLPTSSSTKSPNQREDTDLSVSLVGLMSIHSVLEKQLSLVESRHKSASSLVTETLLREHDLRRHFTVLRTIYFMENGNLAQSFYSYLFKEIEAGTWNNLISLNTQLKVCIEEYFPGFENYFTVQINTQGKRTSSSLRTVHQVIPMISVVYRVEWPLSLIISEGSVESYNKVFRFLLHLKYAFWTLHNIRFSDLAESRHPLWVRHLHVLKTWMLHSTNTLHSYFMGLVLRSYSAHLEDSVLSADSLHVIVQAHNRFLDEVKIHCLQDRKNFLESFIKKLLKLCSLLAELWELEAIGGGDETEAALCALERAFLESYYGLIDCLDMVSPEEDQENFLYELKCEIASSEPSQMWKILNKLPSEVSL